MPYCVVCGKAVFGKYEMCLHGEVTCSAHTVLGRCALCARPRTGAVPGWRPFAAGGFRCPTCVRTAVETQHDSRRLLPVLKARLATLDIRLARPVRVVVSEPAAGGKMPFGWTERAIASGVASSTIHVASGLTETHFGATVAHEVGHCLLGERGHLTLPPQVEEGLCEVFAAAWLARQGTLFATALHDAKSVNPDPVYGAGYRYMKSEVDRHGLAAVLDRIGSFGAVRSNA
jgi:hypothetical protein